MSADILERLDFMLISRRSDEDAIIRDARAEIVRLRGDVDSLRGWFDASRAPSNMSDDHDDAAGDDADDIAPAEAKDPAPAMPNGVEYDRELIARMLTELSSMGSSIFLGESISAQAELLIAADNRDAAGVERQPDGYMAQWAADQLRSNKYVSCHLYNHQNKVIHGDGKEAVPFYFWPPTPAAAPAGEAVAVCGTCNGVGMIGGHRGQTPDSFEQWAEDCPDCTPQPADGEAVAPLGYVRRKAISAMREDDEVTGIMVHVDAPSDSVPVYLHPPAPVQAAPQEGEATLPVVIYGTVYEVPVRVQLHIEHLRMKLEAIGRAAQHHPITDLLDATEHCLSAADEGVDYAVSRPMLDAMTTLGLMEKVGRGKWAPTHSARRFVTLAAAHPSACELGAVRELVDDFTAKGHHSCARDLKAALQHRGDSRGGEG